MITTEQLVIFILYSIYLDKLDFGEFRESQIVSKMMQDLGQCLGIFSWMNAVVTACQEVSCKFLFAAASHISLKQEES